MKPAGASLPHLGPRRVLSAKVGQVPNLGQQDAPLGDVGGNNGQRAGVCQNARGPGMTKKVP